MLLTTLRAKLDKLPKKPVEGLWIDARLHSMLQSLNGHKRTMARLGEVGLVSVQAPNTLVDDRDQMRKFLK